MSKVARLNLLSARAAFRRPLLALATDVSVLYRLIGDILIQGHLTSARNKQVEQGHYPRPNADCVGYAHLHIAAVQLSSVLDCVKPHPEVQETRNHTVQSKLQKFPAEGEPLRLNAAASKA